jgi:hypothetical protein
MCIKIGLGEAVELKFVYNIGLEKSLPCITLYSDCTSRRLCSSSRVIFTVTLQTTTRWKVAEVGFSKQKLFPGMKLSTDIHRGQNFTFISQKSRQRSFTPMYKYHTRVQNSIPRDIRIPYSGAKLHTQEQNSIPGYKIPLPGTKFHTQVQNSIPRYVSEKPISV